LKNIIKLSLYIFVILIFFTSGFAVADEHHGIHVTPNLIDIGANYNGLDAFVTGTMPKDAGVLVRLTGKEGDVHFKQKGKLLKLLWMNLRSVSIDHLPSMMLIYPSKEVEKFMFSKTKEWRNLGLDFDSLKKNIKIRPSNINKESIFNELMKLKQSENLFGIKMDKVEVSNQGNLKKFKVAVKFPSNISDGIYKVETYIIRDGKIIWKDVQQIIAKKSGFPAFLSNMAFNHSLLYGILAVLIALFAGIITGYLFQDGDGAH